MKHTEQMSIFVNCYGDDIVRYSINHTLMDEFNQLPKIGECEIEYESTEIDLVEFNKLMVLKLKEKQSQVRADCVLKENEIQEEINKLICLTHEVEQ